MCKCSKCGETKEKTDFPHAKGVRHCWCRLCNLAAQKLYRQKFRETHPRKHRIAGECLTLSGDIICSKCRTAYPPNRFQNGRVGWCRSCKDQRQKEKAREDGVKERKLSSIVDGKKLCLHCGEFKELTAFYRSVRGLGGLGSYCGPCTVLRYYNKEKGRLQSQKYRKDNKEAYAAAHRVYEWERKHQMKVTSDGSVTKDFLKSLYSQEECTYCDQPTVSKQRTADHVVPLAKNGPHVASNLVMACKTCNSAKRALDVEEFIQKFITEINLEYGNNSNNH